MIKKILYFIVFLSVSVVFVCGAGAMGGHPQSSGISVRVLIVKESKGIDLMIRGDYMMADFESAEVFKEDRNLRETTLTPERVNSKGLTVLPGRRCRVYVNGRQFRGKIDFIKSADGKKLFAVNHVDLEDYLYGVLYHEVSHKWPFDVLKAQAIAARTYALYQKMTVKGKYYDLTSDIYSQVYGGKTSETWKIRRAVNLTRGKVLLCEGKIFPSYYHATCGGMTSDAYSIWNINVPALTGTKCGFCGFSPHYRWKKDMSFADIGKALRKEGYDIEPVSIEILERDKTGRILKLSIKGKRRETEMSGNRFRLIIGPNALRSAHFRCESEGSYITFIGRGWGHGVGMCQWGAYGMARKGWKVEDILRHYYPGAEIVAIETRDQGHETRE